MPCRAIQERKPPPSSSLKTNSVCMALPKFFRIRYSLNAVNVLQGSVKVTAGGVPLTENVDYTVDYTFWSCENHQRWNPEIQYSVKFPKSTIVLIFRLKTMMGSRFDYVFNKDFQIGGTILHLSERPLTQKVNIGDEPISNTIWGSRWNLSYRFTLPHQVARQTSALQHSETSSLTFSGEFAQLVPWSL